MRSKWVGNTHLKAPLSIHRDSFSGLQQFGVISFEIKALMYCHTEQRRTQRFYIAEIVRHRGTVGAWRNRGYLRVFINVLVYFITKQQFARFLKTFITKVISNTYTTALSLFVPSAPLCYRLYAFTSVFSPSPCAFCLVDLLYHSIFRKTHIFSCVFSLPLAILEAMAFKEILILVAIAIEDIDIDIAMDATHLTIRT